MVVTSVCLVLALSGCLDRPSPSPSQPGASPSPRPEATSSQPASGLIGPDGGTVDGPDGTRIVVPPGALAADATIGIARSSTGAPALPQITPVGQVYAFTPHGTTFAVPVTVTLPFASGSVPEGAVPILYKTNAQNAWEPVSGATVEGNAITASVTGFSWGVTGVERRSPQRSWDFIVARNAEVIHDDDSTLAPWAEVHPREVFQANPIDLDGDGQSTLEAFSSADGVTFWASADDVGGSELTQVQGFYKRTPDAFLRFVITAAVLEAADLNQAPTLDECPAGGSDLTTCTLLHGDLEFHADAFDADSEPLLDRNGDQALNAFGLATLNGHAGAWQFNPVAFPNFRQQVFTAGDFDFVEDLNGSTGKTHPRAQLNHHIVIDVDLSRLEVDDKFYVQSLVAAQAVNGRARESAVRAYLRDPSGGSATTVETSGLEVTLEPMAPPTPPGVIPPLPCPTGPDPAAGTIQFSAPTYPMLETHFVGVGDVSVTRAGGMKGAVSATFAAGDGTGVAGTDFEPASTTVRFADGDATPRTLPLEILGNDDAQEDRTVNLTLSDPGGCATLGSPSTAVLTILDDDGVVVRPDTFTVGGRVNGLIGTVVLENHRGLFLEVTDDGPFTFTDIPTPAGEPYFVKVFNQPHQPQQTCTVTNGEGTFSDHDVTDVLVSCV